MRVLFLRKLLILLRLVFIYVGKLFFWGIEMNKKKLSQVDAQRDVDKLCEQQKNKRKIDDFAYRDLVPHLTEILLWARSEGGSRTKLVRLVKIKFNIDVGRYRIYRFVKKYNDGIWPQQCAKKGEKS